MVLLGPGAVELGRAVGADHVGQHRARHDDRSLGDPGDLRPPRRRIDLRQADGVAVAVDHAHGAAVGGQQVEQHLGGRGLAGARGARQRHQAPGTDPRCQPGRGPGAARRDAQVLDLDDGGGQVGRRERPASGRGRIEDLEDGVGGGDPVGRGVEVEPDLPQRLVDLGSDHDDQEGGRQVHVAEQQAESHLHGHDRDRQRCDELQDRPGQEGDPEGLHGGRVVGLAQRPHALGGAGLTAQGLQGGKPGEQVEHLPAQTLHGLQALLGVALGEPPDEDHEDGDERDCARHGDGGGQVLHEHDQAGQGRHRRGEEKLGEITCEVRLEVVQAPCEQGGGAGVVLGRPARSQRRGVLQDPAAQLDDRAGGGAVSEGLLGVEDGRARRHDERQQPDQGCDRAEGGVRGHDGGHGPRDEDGLHDDEHRGRAAEQRGDDDVAPGSVRVAHEPRIQRLHRSRIVALGLWSRPSPAGWLIPVLPGPARSQLLPPLAETGPHSPPAALSPGAGRLDDRLRNGRSDHPARLQADRRSRTP